MITNTDHKAGLKSPSPPPGASGTKYLLSSRTAATSAAAASLITARPGSSGLSGRILRLSRGGLSGRAAHEQRQQQGHDTGQYHDDTEDVHVQAMGVPPREGRRSGAGLPAGVRADGCTAGRDVLGGAALSAG
jgi:hypothetical protein